MIEERSKLRRRQPHHSVGDRGPFEGTLFQPFPYQQQTAAVPNQKLDPIARTDVIPHTMLIC
jgi:hypothetical protein